MAQRLLERQLRATERSRGELQALLRLGSSLAATTDLDDLRRRSAGWLLATLRLRRVVLYGPSLNDEPWNDRVELGDPRPRGPSIEANATVRALPPIRRPEAQKETDHGLAVQAACVAEQEICRVLLDPGEEQPWTSARWRLVEGALAEIAPAIGGGLQIARLRWMADHDALTDLWNVRRVHDELRRAFRNARDGVHKLSLALIDIDDFKRVNDTYGHATGDELLREVAKVIRSSMPDGAIVGRTGGDEFLVGFPRTTKKAAEAALTTVIASIADTGFRVPHGEQIPVNLSYGIVAYPADSATLGGLLAEVDARLYESRFASETRELARELAGDDQAGGGSSYDVLIGLVTAVDRKDHYTGRHSELVAAAAKALAEATGLSNETCSAVRLGGLLHDVGKIGVPDSVLRKPGKLTAAEMDAMRSHVALGEAIVINVPHQVEVQQAIAYHHERFDGRGYPRGLPGPEVPLIGRIMAIADAFAAMTADRPYRKGLTVREARREIRTHASTQFDPVLAQRFVILDLEHLLAAPGEAGIAEPHAASGDGFGALATRGHPLAAPGRRELSDLTS